MPKRAKRRGLGELQKLILVQLLAFSITEDEIKSVPIRHWDLLFAVAKRYKFDGKHVKKMPEGYRVTKVVSYGQVEISYERKNTYQYIDHAFQVSFSRSLKTLQERGFVRLSGVRKVSRVYLSSVGLMEAQGLSNTILHWNEQRKRIAKMPVCVPPNKRISSAKPIRAAF